MRWMTNWLTPRRIGLTAFVVMWVTLCAMAAHRVSGADVASLFDSTLHETSAEHWLPTKDARQVGGYYLAYDGRARTARYVLEFLTPQSLRKRVARASGFRFDPEAPPEARATPASYERSGYDQGHLAPAADWLGTEKLQAATFVLSNVAPQVPTCNRGVWKQLEAHVRAIAEDSDATVVVTAPLYLAKADGESFTVRVLGRDRVWVPTHFGKAILWQDHTGGLQMAAWIVPNEESDSTDYDCFSVSMDAFEAAVGLDLWAPLPDSVERDLEREPKLVPMLE